MPADRFAAPAQNLYFRAGAATPHGEWTSDRRVNHGTLDAELGYFVTPRLTARLA